MDPLNEVLHINARTLMSRLQAEFERSFPTHTLMLGASARYVVRKLLREQEEKAEQTRRNLEEKAAEAAPHYAETGDE